MDFLPEFYSDNCYITCLVFISISIKPSLSESITIYFLFKANSTRQMYAKHIQHNKN